MKIDYSPVEMAIEIKEVVRMTVAVAVTVGVEAVVFQEVRVEPVRAVERTLLIVFLSAHVIDFRAGEAVRVILVLEALREPLLEVVRAGSTTVVLSPAVVVQNGAGLLEVAAIGAVNDLNLGFIIPVAVPLAFVEIDPEGGGAVGAVQVQVVEDAEQTLHEGIVSGEHVEFRVFSIGYKRIRPVFVDNGSLAKLEVSATDPTHFDHELLELPGIHERLVLGGSEVKVVRSLDS